jgi:nucleoid-associated protein YgaU
MRNIIKIASVFALIFAMTASLSYAQELTCGEWTMDQYNAKMAELQKREADAKAEITATDQKLEKVAAETAELEKLTVAEWQAIYESVSATEDDVNSYRNSLDAIESKIDGLAALSPEDLFQRRKEICALEEELKALGENKISLLSEMQDKTAMIEGKISQLRASLPKADFDEYTVVKGDYLWKIAGKEDIYDDPYQWIRIFSYNREQIKDADIIFAEQIFKIQRSAADNEYIVVKGDWLAKIASKAEVFNDPTKWTKLFEANNNVITDKDVIYPHQVLIIPE